MGVCRLVKNINPALISRPSEIFLLLCELVTPMPRFLGNKYIYRFFDPLITVAMPVPGIAWAPIFMLGLGFRDPPIITVGALAAFFPIVYNTATGVRSVDRKLIWSARSMGADRKMGDGPILGVNRMKTFSRVIRFLHFLVPFLCVIGLWELKWFLGAISPR